jgi:fructuronate reductase
LREFVQHLMSDEMLPTLSVPTGFDVSDYCATLLQRFANPTLRHRTTQVAMDGSQKLPQRLLPAAQALLERNASPRLIGLAVAAWMRYVTARVSESGGPLPVNDPLEQRIAAATAGADSPAAVCAALLGLTEIFGDELPADPRFRDAVLDGLDALTRGGVVRAIRAVLGAA